MATAPTASPQSSAKAPGAALPPPVAGDLLPDFQLQDQSMRVSVLSTQALGQPIALLLTPDPAAPAAAKLLRAVAEAWNDVGAQFHLFCITAVPPPALCRSPCFRIPKARSPGGSGIPGGVRPIPSRCRNACC